MQRRASPKCRGKELSHSFFTPDGSRSSGSSNSPKTLSPHTNDDRFSWEEMDISTRKRLDFEAHTNTTSPNSHTIMNMNKNKGSIITSPDRSSLHLPPLSPQSPEDNSTVDRLQQQQRFRSSSRKNKTISSNMKKRVINPMGHHQWNITRMASILFIIYFISSVIEINEYNSIKNIQDSVEVKANSTTTTTTTILAEHNNSNNTGEFLDEGLKPLKYPPRVVTYTLSNAILIHNNVAYSQARNQTINTKLKKSQNISNTNDELFLSYNTAENVDNNDGAVVEGNESEDALGGQLEKGWKDDCAYMVDWQSKFYPTCNIMHEIGLGLPYDEHEISESDQGKSKKNLSNIIEPGTKLLGEGGSWRMTFTRRLLDDDNESYSRNNIRRSQTFVLKMLRLDREFNAESFERNRIDSIAMERLTASEHVINEYTFCGQSVITDYVHGSVNSLVKQPHLQSKDRLDLAYRLVKGLEDIHGIDYKSGNNVTFVHNDINPANVVQLNNSTLKFNDFNIGIPIRWNKSKSKQCSFPVAYRSTFWRAPEELEGDYATSKIDVYSLGNILFQILTQREPFKHLEPIRRPTEAEVFSKKKNGILPHVPDEFAQANDPAMQIIYHAMVSCYTFDPKKRPSAKAIRKKMQEAMKLINKKSSTTDKKNETGMNVKSRIFDIFRID